MTADNVIVKQIKDLKVGDMLDLEGDVFADIDRNKPEFHFEYATVESVEPETPNCTVVNVEELGSYGFPPDHYVRVVEQL